MTSNQINYWNYVENSRHNQAVETETHRSNVTNERETYRSNRARETETERHNRADEQIRFEANQITSDYNNGYLSEMRRHNQASEENERAKVGAQYYASDTSRANAATAAGAQYAGVSLGYAQLSEQQRLNNLVTSETHRSNVVDEANKRVQNRAEEKRAEAARKQAETQAGNLAFEQEKWSSMGYQNAQANLNKVTSETARNYAQAERYPAQTENERRKWILDLANTIVDAADVAGRTALRTIPFLGGN